MTSETDAEYVSRFVSVHGRLPEYCTRCEQWEGVCWHHLSPPVAPLLEKPAP